jgi:histidinol-phosphate aminotransferase
MREHFMQVTRRNFVSGLSTAGAFALSGLAGEIRGAAEQVEPSSSAARILFNENPLGPSPKALAAIRNASSLFCRYPLGEAPQLEMKLRKLHGLPFNEIAPGLSLARPQQPSGDSGLLMGVGSSEILKAIAWAYCSEGGNVVEAHPGYSAVGAEAVRIPNSSATRKLLPLDANNRIDVAAMLDAIDSETRVVVICNPNNPTGSTLTLSEIEQLADATPPQALLLVDEAYIEFLANQEAISAVELAKSRKNVLVARTFSKIYGLAGLRLGYGLGSVDVLDKLHPYMLGGLSLSMAGVVGADAALDDAEHVTATRNLNLKVQESWQREFPRLGWKTTPSDACFAWVNVGQDCASLVKFLATRNVLISGGQRWDLPNYVRISIGTEDENERLLAAANAFHRA